MKIHTILERDSHFVGDLKLCQIRMIPDGENTWFLLIPKLEGMVDWSDLKISDQYLLTEEIDFVCKRLKEKVRPDKLNVASLGNMVPQLHIHIIARYKTDRAWPGPIWGTESNVEFKDSILEEWKNIFSNS